MARKIIRDKKIILDLLRQFQNYEVLQQASDRLKKDPEVVSTAMKINLVALAYADTSLRENTDFLLDNLVINTEKLSQNLSSDPLSHVEDNPEHKIAKAFQYLCGEWTAAFEQITADEKSNWNFILKLLKKNIEKCSCFFKGSESLKRLFLFGIAMILPVADQDLRNNKQFLLSAIKLSPFAYIHASDDLKRNHNILLTALKKQPSVLKHAPAFLQKNKHFLSQALIIHIQNPKENLLPENQERYLFEKIKIRFGRISEIFGFSNTDIRSDKDFILKILKRNASNILSYFDKEHYGDLGQQILPEMMRILNHIDNTLKEDEEFLLAAIRIHPSAFFYTGNVLQQSQDFLKKALKENLSIIHYRRHMFDQTLWVDLIKEHPIIFSYEVLQDLSASYLSAALDANPEILKHLSSDQKKDKRFIFIASKKDPKAIQYADLSLQKNKKFILRLIQKNPAILAHANEGRYASDPEFVFYAVSKNGLALQFASDALRADPKIINAAIAHHPQAQIYALTNTPPIAHSPALETRPQAPALQREPNQNTLRQKSTQAPIAIHKSQPATNNFPLLGSALIGSMVGIVLGLVSTWALEVSALLSLSILGPLCCLASLAIHGLLRTKTAPFSLSTIEKASQTAPTHSVLSSPLPLPPRVAFRNTRTTQPHPTIARKQQIAI